jgi:hypothetical protein
MNVTHAILMRFADFTLDYTGMKAAGSAQSDKHGSFKGRRVKRLDALRTIGVAVIAAIEARAAQISGTQTSMFDTDQSLARAGRILNVELFSHL